MRRKYKERRLYFFNCEVCGSENRQTFRRSKAKRQMCRKCRKVEVNPNQGELFPLPANLETV